MLKAQQVQAASAPKALRAHKVARALRALQVLKAQPVQAVWAPKALRAHKVLRALRALRVLRALPVELVPPTSTGTAGERISGTRPHSRLVQRSLTTKSSQRPFH